MHAPAHRDSTLKTPLLVRLRGVPKEFQRPGTMLSTLLERTAGRPVLLRARGNAQVDVAITSTHLPGLRRAAGLSETHWARMFGADAGRFPARMWAVGVDEPLARARVNLWFSGENVRPPVGRWDLTLSHDVDDFQGTNVYFPYWIEALGIYASPTVNFLGQVQTLDALLANRQTDWVQREGFVCAFLGKTSGLRMHAIEALRRRGPVEVFGPAVGRPVKDKMSIAKDFKFVLCFENDLYPGYVTEKPFDAWGTGAIPLWWGSDPAGYLNEESMLNLANFENIEAFADAVADLSVNKHLGRTMSERPILTRPPDMLTIEARVRRALAPVLGDF